MSCWLSVSHLLLASSSSLIVRWTRLSTVGGDRAFLIVAARVWNNLPQHVTSAPSLYVFASRLKTHFLSRTVLNVQCCEVTSSLLDTLIDHLTYLTWPTWNLDMRVGENFNPLIATLKPQSNGPSYSNTVIGTLAVDGWAATFVTARRGLGGAAAPQASPRPPTNGQCTKFVLFDVAL